MLIQFAAQAGNDLSNQAELVRGTKGFQGSLRALIRRGGHKTEFYLTANGRARQASRSQPPTHSCRNDTEGSIDAARRAGTYDAAKATAASAAATAAKVCGSAASVRKSSDFNSAPVQ